jgi:hypothetical protein
MDTIDINLRAFQNNCHNTGKITLATLDHTRYINIMQQGTRCTHPDDAKALRDALISIYPLEATKPAYKFNVGDRVQPSECNKGYFGNVLLPLVITKIYPATTSDGDLFYTKDARGKVPSSAFGFRLDGYAEPTKQCSSTVSAPAKWEVVADGLDRIKVPGGWIYQSVDGVQTFVPEPK